MTPSNTKPIWQDSHVRRYSRLTTPQSVDVAVVGGGITGLTAAFFLKQAGKKVCLLERDRLGSGDTGRTTAHLTCVTDLRLKQLFDVFGKDGAAIAWHAGQSAIDAIEQIVRMHRIDCEFRRVPAYLHAAIHGTDDETDALKQEVELAVELGFDADFVPSVPIVGSPGMRVPNQAKFRPLEYLAALAAAVQGHGSSVHEHTEVTDVEDGPPLVVVAKGVRVTCDQVVIATQVPLMGKAGLLSASLLQTKLVPYSTYVVSGRLPPRSLPEVNLWDTSNPYHYLRIDAEPDCDRVIFGGNDHKTGQVDNTQDCYERLETTLREVIPAALVDRRWSGQVIETNDGLPLIGEAVEGQFVATGFNGNGMTFATVAAMIIHDAILNRENLWKELFSLERKQIRGGAWDYVRQNLDYPYYMLADRLRRSESSSPDEIAKGQGKILKLDGQKVACSRDDQDRLHQVSAVCTHLGCIVHWNQAEQTWDCPCHGSRFDPAGRVLAGPAESPLGPVGHRAAEDDAAIASNR